MAHVDIVFRNLENIHKDGHSEFATLLQHSDEQKHSHILKKLLTSIFNEIHNLASILEQNDTILISVKHQKLLRASFQLIASLGVLPCLLPGVGVSLSKRCTVAVPCITLNDDEKYELLVLCTEFMNNCYTVPVLKHIIITFHLCDYLAALIQLSFAPLKKPGIYENFTMTPEKFAELSSDRLRFVSIYNSLVVNCFQPTLMKELLVLTGAEPAPPKFVKKVIAKEMSRRLLAAGGLLSLIRCFMECYEFATGSNNQWMKTDMICKLVVFKHGTISEEDYLGNICSQLIQILSLHKHYLAPAVACAMSLHKKYSNQKPVQDMTREMFRVFDYDTLNLKANFPGTLILSPLEVENKINILDACANTKGYCPKDILINNIPVLAEVAIKFDKRNYNIVQKITHIILKCLENCGQTETQALIKSILFGERKNNQKITVEEFYAGVAIKCQECTEEYPIEAGMSYFLQVFRSSDDGEIAAKVLDTFLKLFAELTDKRSANQINGLLSLDEVVLLDSQYACTLQALIEISTEQKVLCQSKKSTASVLNFVEYFLVKFSVTAEDDFLAICLALLNTILPEATKEVKERCNALIPILQKVAHDETHSNSMLCKEAISLINGNHKSATDSAFEKAVSNVLDSCLPVRAHGIIELTRLVNSKDRETMSKKHYLFCLFKEHLKDQDSYIYLSAVNGLAALGTHFTEDVLSELCKEFLDATPKTNEMQTNAAQNDAVEMRMKIGDVIVKVTKRIGEMAVAHKTLLLNTMLCASREPEPLLRASALSNLAELARALHYRLGTIIYEVLLVIWDIIETDKAIECRRAAVMVIASLIKGLGADNLVELKEQLLPIYRTLKKLYSDENEDHIVRLHSQLALEELNDTTRQLMFPDVKIEKKIVVLN